VSSPGGVYALDATVPRYPRRFRWRVIRYILLISLVASAVAFGYSFLRQSEFLRQDRHARGRLLSQTLAEGADLGLLVDEPALVRAALDRILEHEDVLRAEVYRPDGSCLIQRQRPRAVSSQVPPPRVVKRLLAAREPTTVVVAGEDRDEYYSAVLAPEGDAVVAAYGAVEPALLRQRVVGFVRLSLSHLQQQQREEEMLLWSVYLAGGLLLLGFVLAVLVGWRLSRPILKLAAGADAIRRGNLDVQVNIRSYDELGQLADSFNRMVWKLKTTVDQLADLNRNLETQVNERTQDIRGMAGFLEILNAQRELQSLVDNALGALIERTGGVLGAVYLYNEGASTLTLFACAGVSAEAFGDLVVKLGEGPVGRAAQDAEPVVVVGQQDNERLSRAYGEPLHTVLYQRMRFAEALAGVVVVGATSPVSRRRREALVQSTHPLAIAVSNAKAFGAAERLAQELEARNVELTRQTELLEEQKAQLEEMNRLKSELMANITHELRTPLNAVIGYAELMHGGAYGELSPEQAENLEAILDSARSLLDLITQILDMAKMEAGQMGLVISEVDLGAVLRDAAQTAQVLARGKPVRVGLGVPEGGLILSTDEGKLRQIVNNLVSNAVKFTDEGRVELLCGRRPDASVQILVRDTGEGIAPQHQSIIFDEFRQVDGSTTRHAMGTGLGLAISRKFARLLGGDLTVQSTLAQGSTFIVHLPARPPQEAVDVSSAMTGLDDASQALGFSTHAGGAPSGGSRSAAAPRQGHEQDDGKGDELTIGLLDEGLTRDR